MEIDHIFIFSPDGGSEADQLQALGLVEGSSRRHPDQGTTNRKFYFENFFLEVLWVVDEAEIQRLQTKETSLWDRSRFQETGMSRFGLCLSNTPATDPVFSTAHAYQPDYFPTGMSIDTLAHFDCPNLPMAFRLPFRGGGGKPAEPLQEGLGIGQLTRATFQFQQFPTSPFVEAFQHSPQIHFEAGEQDQLILEFDQGRQGKEVVVEALDLSLKY